MQGLCLRLAKLVSQWYGEGAIPSPLEIFFITESHQMRFVVTKIYTNFAGKSLAVQILLTLRCMRKAEKVKCCSPFVNGQYLIATEDYFLIEDIPPPKNLSGRCPPVPLLPPVWARFSLTLPMWACFSLTLFSILGWSGEIATRRIDSRFSVS